MTRTRELQLYLHTHWDREWYLPYETFRTQLVSVVRQVLDGLANDSLPNFLLDGQALALEDIIEVEPDLEKAVRREMKKGKLGAGPWYVLADQMLVSGESLVRNLKLGLEVTSSFGPPSMVGYCPDTFGHTQDLPMILNGFGIDNAVVWRGVPDHGNGSAFRWQGPDGSSVVAYHLTRGYYQPAFNNCRPAEEIAKDLGGWLKLDGLKLVPVGGDHLAPPANFKEALSKVEKELNQDGQEQLVLKPVPLSKFLEKLVENDGELQVIKGELRDNSSAKEFERAYLLQGVLSTRLYLKRNNRNQEHRITQIVEPLLAMLDLVGVKPYPHHELKHAWKLLLQNHPHDSICGCSVDEVHREMLTRTGRFHHVLDAVEKAAAAALAEKKTNAEKGRFALSQGFVADPAQSMDTLNVFNLSPVLMTEPIRFQWAAPLGEPAPDTVLQQVHRIGTSGLVVQLVSKNEQSVVFTTPGGEPCEKPVRLFDAWIWPGEVQSFGWKTLGWSDPFKEPKIETGDLEKPVIVSDGSINNGLLQVKIAPNDDVHVWVEGKDGGTRVYRLRHRIRDVADAGDTYNFDGVENDVPLRAELCSVEVGQRGPLCGSLTLTYEIAIPQCAAEIVSLTEHKERTQSQGVPSKAPVFERSGPLRKHVITTEVSLRRNLPIVFFETSWINHSADHRLEVVFDTEEEVTETISENHFSTVCRPVVQAGKEPVELATESPLTRYPCQRFFIASGQLFLNKGLPEYGTEETNVCLTILRAVSRLSRPRLRSRGGGAGPSLPTPEADCLGENTVSYGWAPVELLSATAESEFVDMDEMVAMAYELAEIYHGRSWAALGRAVLPAERRSLMSLDNDFLRLMAVNQNAGGDAIIRLLNVSAVRQEAKLTFSLKNASLKKCRLDETDIVEVPRIKTDNKEESVFDINCQPHELVTLKLLCRRRPS